jgi:hypothetical protein
VKGSAAEAELVLIVVLLRMLNQKLQKSGHVPVNHGFPMGLQKTKCAQAHIEAVLATVGMKIPALAQTVPAAGPEARTLQ